MVDADDGHLWRLVGVQLGGDSGTEYVCELCDEVLVVPAGAVPPTTV